jgi:hypothetical protein
MPNKKTEPRLEKVLFRLHPRVFAALGTGLVTNDLVAIIELVKNSYDAFASHVDVRFIGNSTGQISKIEIQDDGEGMTHDLITDVWCEVATPYRTIEPLRAYGRTRRRVSGEKGLGRLSAARLGSAGRFWLIGPVWPIPSRLNLVLWRLVNIPNHHHLRNQEHSFVSRRLITNGTRKRNSNSWKRICRA